MRRAVFLERDGILNQARVERGNQVSPLSLEEFRVNAGARALVELLKAAGLVVIGTTNQPGLSRGYQSRWELDRMHEVLRREVPLDDLLVCPHDESDRCACRKPKPGLLLEAGFKWNLDLDRSFVVSDKWQDAEAGRVAGCTSLLLRSPWVASVHHDFLLPSLEAIGNKLLQIAKVPPAAVA